MLIQIQDTAAYFYTAGKPFNAALPSTVFIHGAQNDHSVWSLQSRYFAYHGHNVLAPDLPGHGRSSAPALTSIEAMAAWLLELLDQVGISQANLVGHSMGSLIALETARVAPQRVANIALLGNAYPMKVASALLAMAQDDEPKAIAMVNSWSHLNGFQRTQNPGFNLQGNARRLMQRMSAINPASLLYNDFSACNNYQQGEAAAAVMHERAIATLFVMASADRMTPAKASATLRTAMPNAVVTEIAQCGHSMMTEQPDAVLKALIGFL